MAGYKLMKTNSVPLTDELQTLKLISSWDSTKTCLPRTREVELDWIQAEVFKLPAPPAGENKPLFLTGVTGSGKTAIANSLAKIFSELHCLGAASFFDRTDPTKSTTSQLFGSVARQLASCDPILRKAIGRALAQSPDLAVADERRQFSALIREPCLLAPDGRTLVLIFDALDECNRSESFLDLIATEFPKLPARFRVILTGRWEDAISRALRSAVLRHDLPHEGEVARRDVSVLIEARMRKIASDHNLGHEWPTRQKTQELIDLAAGLFIWAKTACDFIESSTIPPQKRLETVLYKKEHVHHLDGLYDTTLRASLEWDEPDVREAFEVFVGIIISAETPLSIGAIDRIAASFPKCTALRASDLLNHLQSLLVKVDTSDVAAPVKLLHVSFRDFLTQNNASDFYIDTTPCHTNMALACFGIMNLALKRNICGVPDSEVADMIRWGIHPRLDDEVLRYAILHGIDHVVKAPTSHISEVLAEAVTEFIDLHLLHWLETLAAHNFIEIARHLLYMKEWLEVRPVHALSILSIHSSNNISLI